MGKLTPRFVQTIKTAGRHGDGRGLYLHVKPSGTKSWLLRYQLNGRRRDMGLGPYPEVGLAQARENALDARRQAKSSIDPIHARQAEGAKALTFREAAIRLIEAKRPEWKNDKHAGQWTATLQTYAFPELGEHRVADIRVNDVLQVLTPIWTQKHETATRVRQRIEAVLDWAKAKGLRTGENPAQWRGNLDKLLPRISKKRRVRHHPALPYSQISDFMAELRSIDGLAARALELTILTACRTSEVLHARWIEIDGAVWTIPATRTKTSTEHRVPLSKGAVAVLADIPQMNKWVFPGRGNKPISNMAMLSLLKRMNRGNLTVHGFRSTFRDWTAEQTDTPHHVAEQALGHSINNAVEAAYRRGDLLEKRRLLMRQWWTYCGS